MVDPTIKGVKLAFGDSIIDIHSRNLLNQSTLKLIHGILFCQFTNYLSPRPVKDRARPIDKDGGFRSHFLQ